MQTGYTRAEAAKRLGLNERTFSRRVARSEIPRPDEETGLFPADAIDRLAARGEQTKSSGDPIYDGFANLVAEMTVAMRDSRAHVERLIALNEKPFAVLESLMAKVLDRLSAAEKAQLDYQAAHGELLLGKDERERENRVAEIRSKALLDAVEMVKMNLPVMLAQVMGGSGGQAFAKQFVAEMDGDERFGMLMMSTQLAGKKRRMMQQFLALGGLSGMTLPPDQKAAYDAAEAAAQAREQQANGSGEHAAAPH